MGDKAGYISAIVAKMAERVSGDFPGEKLDTARRGLEKMNAADLTALNAVLYNIINTHEEQMNSALRHDVPERVPEDFHPHLIERLDKSTQSGEVEAQMDTLAGLGVVMGDSWRHGRLGVVKNQVSAVERICENIKRVIKAQLYSSLK